MVFSPGNNRKKLWKTMEMDDFPWERIQNAMARLGNREVFHRGKDLQMMDFPQKPLKKRSVCWFLNP